LFLRKGGSVAVAIAFAVPLIVLLATVRTSVGFWDTGDLQTVAWIGGIPYPTGYPLYVVVGWVWTHALPFASVAARVNALSAVAIAAGAATLCSLALLLEVGATIAILAGWMFAFAHTVWYRATYADAHPIGFAVAFLAVVFAVRWALRGESRSAVAAIVLGGVALAFDNTTVLILAGGAVLAFARRLPVRPAALAAAAAVLIVVAAYAYLPLRSAQLTAARADPTLQLGVEPGRPFWDDHHPATSEGFRALVAGSEWGPGTTLAHLFSVDAIRKTEQRFGPDLAGDFPQGLTIAALLGLGFLAWRLPLVGLGLIVAAVVPALFGGSYRAEADPERYAFALYAVTALGIGLAADGVVRAITPARSVVAHRVVVGLLVVAIGWELLGGGDLFASRDDRDAVTLGAAVAAATHDDAVVIVRWDWATPLAYRAYVEQAFGRRIVLCAFPEDYADRIGGWLRTRQVAIVAEFPPLIPGFIVRRLRSGNPAVFEVLARPVRSSART
jgi:hypothetical protein